MYVSPAVSVDEGKAEQALNTSVLRAWSPGRCTQPTSFKHSQQLCVCTYKTYMHIYIYRYAHALYVEIFLSIHTHAYMNMHNMALFDLARVLPNVKVPVKMDHLGPVIVNEDGSMRRIANWPLAELEACMYVCICTCKVIHMCIYIYIYIHTYMHAYIYIYI